MIVTPGAGCAGRRPVLEGRQRRDDRRSSVSRSARSRAPRSRCRPRSSPRGYDLDPLATRNLLEFLREQQDATRVIPSDRTIVVERFRDEIGDWRLCVLSPYGGRVHAAWALALSARLRDELGLESDAIWSDEGIIVHLPDADEPPGADTVLLDPETIEDQVVAELGASALFGARFRENAARALLIPRAYPGRRTPLWQQRLKAQSLLEVAKRYADFPIILETYRECLRDVLDVPGPARAADAAAHARALARRGRDAHRVALRERAAVRLRRDVHVRGRHAERGAPRGRAVARPRPAARAARPGRAARADRPGRARGARGRPAAPLGPHARGLERRARRHPAARRRPHRGRGAGARARGARRRRRFLDTLRRERRAVRVRVAGEERWIAADDAGLYRDAVGAVPPGGLPEAFLAAAERPLEELLSRYARTHGPFTTSRGPRPLRGRRLEPARGDGEPRRAHPRRAAPTAAGARARVVRSGCPATDPPRVARRPA